MPPFPKKNLHCKDISIRTQSLHDQVCHRPGSRQGIYHLLENSEGWHGYHSELYNIFCTLKMLWGHFTIFNRLFQCNRPM